MSRRLATTGCHSYRRAAWEGAARINVDGDGGRHATRLRLHFDSLHTIASSNLPDRTFCLVHTQHFKMHPTQPVRAAPEVSPPSSARAQPTAARAPHARRAAPRRASRASLSESPQAPTGGAACFPCCSCWAAAIIIIFSCIIITTACILFCFTARASRSASHFFFRSACFLCRKSFAASGDFSAHERQPGAA